MATTKTETPQALPGMQHRNIRDLDITAHRYAIKRDVRIQISREEKALKNQLITLMHKHGKTHYLRKGLEVTLVPKDEDVKVKVQTEKPDEDEPDEDLDDEPDNDDEEDEDPNTATLEPPMGDPPSTKPPLH